MLPLHHAPILLSNGIIAPKGDRVKHKNKKVLTADDLKSKIENMRIRLVIVNTEDCLKLLAEPERFCSAGRLEKCRRTVDARARAQGYAAELALSYCLSGPALLPPEYRYEKSGKPVIDGGHISLAHSGKYGVCAYSDAPVGADIEVNRVVSPALARRILCAEERDEYRAAPDNEYLLRKFVIKEAYFKLTGEGIGGRFSDVREDGGRLSRRGKAAGYAKVFTLDYAIGCIVTEEEFEDSDAETAILTDGSIESALPVQGVPHEQRA